ncbi:MAG TPA: D-amino acid dehydrogenase [Gammaproteobacteria bacterium]|nr:D-amino acid dehydrogenase [Gammaproteobacteria bacterium]
MKRDVIVIGAGLIGTTTAWYLAERGLNVAVVERRENSGLETSFANGGLLTPSEADPWNAPGTLGRLLHWLGREDSPLLLRPRALPGMLGWGLKFLRASRPEPHLRSTMANLRLALYSLSSLDELDQKLSLNYNRLHNGTLKIFRDRKALNNSLELADSLRHLGLESRLLNPEEAVGFEPLLEDVSKQLVGAIYYPRDGSGDAYRFTCEIQKHAIAAGVKFHFNACVSQIRSQSRRIQALLTEQGEIIADNYVLTAGSYSPQLARLLGLRLPIYPVKGYSVTVTPDIHHSMRVPIVDFEQKIVITPLGKQLRIAGTAEFNGYDTALNLTRGANILRQAVAILPWLEDSAKQEGVTHWTGLRPMTCDGPPILGASPYTNLFFNTGHGPLGWTLGAGSARCVADMVSGLRPEIDVAAYRYNRFI